MFITGIGIAAPTQRYDQKQGWQAIQCSPQFGDLTPRSRAILKKVLCGDNGITSRHLALETLEEVFLSNPDRLQERFALHAPALAVEAAQKALDQAGFKGSEMDALLVSTCTGYLCPGLTSYVCEQLRMKPGILALDLVGQGCGAALPNLRTADALLAGGKANRVLSICVEVCSAAFFLDNDPGVLISACLFGDGAGAAVLERDPPRQNRRIEWLNSASHLDPSQRDILRFSHKNGMLRNILLPQVPEVAGAAAGRLLQAMIAEANMKPIQIRGWILHAGGRDVLLALRKNLRLSAEDVRHSSAVLREYGNISSPTVYFVLQKALQDSVPDGFWWMSSFGAGFSCHGALLEVTT